MRIIHTPYYKECKRLGAVEVYCYSVIAFLVVAMLTASLIHYAATHKACTSAVHITRTLEVYKYGEHVHVWRKSYDNCK